MPTKKTIIITSILTISLIANLALSFFLFQKNSDKVKDIFLDKSVDKIYYNKNNQTITFANSKGERWQDNSIAQNSTEVRRLGDFLEVSKTYGNTKSKIYEIAKVGLVDQNITLEPEFSIVSIKSKNDYFIQSNSLETSKVYRVVNGNKQEFKRCNFPVYFKDDILCYSATSNEFSVAEKALSIKISDTKYSYVIDAIVDRDSKNLYFLNIGDISSKKLFIIRYNFETKESKELEINNQQELVRFTTDRDGNIMAAGPNEDKSKLITYLVKDTLEPIYESQDEVRIY